MPRGDAVAGNGGAGDEMDGLVFEYRLGAGGEFGVGMFPGETGNQLGFAREERHQFVAPALEGFDLPVNVVVVQSDDGKADA